MLKYSLVIEVDRLKNLAETLGWKTVKEEYIDNNVVVSFAKVIPKSDEGHSKKE